MSSARATAVKAAFEAFRLLECACADRVAAQAAGAARHLHDCVDRLAAIGCEIEGRFLRELRARLASFAPTGFEDLSAHLGRSSLALDAVAWLPPACERLAAPVILVRHAESTGNVERRLQGSRIGGALTPRGYVQAKLTAERLFRDVQASRSPDAILLSSPGHRALETARAIGQRLGCDPRTHEGVAEIDFGDWSGRHFADLERDGDYAAWMKDKWFRAPPGGESLFEVRTRVCEALAPFVQRASTSAAPLLVVTHFFPLMALLSALLDGTAVQAENGSITRIDYEARAWKASLTNCVAHLGNQAAAAVAYV